MVRFACLRVKGAQVLLRSDGPALGNTFCVLQKASHVSAAKKIQFFSCPSTLTRKKGAS